MRLSQLPDADSVLQGSGTQGQEWCAGWRTGPPQTGRSMARTICATRPSARASCRTPPGTARTALPQLRSSSARSPLSATQTWIGASPLYRFIHADAFLFPGRGALGLSVRLPSLPLPEGSRHASIQNFQWHSTPSMNSDLWFSRFPCSTSDFIVDRVARGLALFTNKATEAQMTQRACCGNAPPCVLANPEDFLYMLSTGYQLTKHSVCADSPTTPQSS